MERTVSSLCWDPNFWWPTTGQATTCGDWKWCFRLIEGQLHRSTSWSMRGIGSQEQIAKPRTAAVVAPSSRSILGAEEFERRPAEFVQTFILKQLSRIKNIYNLRSAERKPAVFRRAGWATRQFDVPKGMLIQLRTLYTTAQWF